MPSASAGTPYSAGSWGRSAGTSGHTKPGLLHPPALHIDRGIVFAEREGFRALELDVYRPAASRAERSRAAARLRPRRRLAAESPGTGTPRDADWAPGFFERLTAAGFVVAAPDVPLQRRGDLPGATRRRPRRDPLASRQRRRSRRRPRPHVLLGDLSRRPPRRPGRARPPPAGGGRRRVLVPGHRPPGARPPDDRFVRGAAPRRPDR